MVPARLALPPSHHIVGITNREKRGDGDPLIYTLAHEREAGASSAMDFGDNRDAVCKGVVALERIPGGVDIEVCHGDLYIFDKRVGDWGANLERNAVDTFFETETRVLGLYKELKTSGGFTPVTSPPPSSSYPVVKIPRERGPLSFEFMVKRIATSPRIRAATGSIFLAKTPRAAVRPEIIRPGMHYRVPTLLDPEFHFRTVIDLRGFGDLSQGAFDLLKGILTAAGFEKSDSPAGGADDGNAKKVVEGSNNSKRKPPQKFNPNEFTPEEKAMMDSAQKKVEDFKAGIAKFFKYATPDWVKADTLGAALVRGLNSASEVFKDAAKRIEDWMKGKGR